MEDKLQDLVDRLRKAQRERLVSVILYGSAVTSDPRGEFGDYNILCVLTQVQPAELADCEPVFKWWRGQGNPSPLLLSENEVHSSTDCFPIEFHDISERRRVLFGKDVIAGLSIDDSFYRAQVELELRSKLLRLRQQAGGIITDKHALLRLMVESVSTFLVLARHALRLSGVTVGHGKRDIADALRDAGADPVPFGTLLDIREQTKKSGDVDPEALFASYLRQVESVVAHVDRLEK
jgi:hypothetical protein